MKDIMENMWFHVIVHAVNEFQNMLKRGTEPLIRDWWQVGVKLGPACIVEISRASIVGHPSDSGQLLYAPPGVRVENNVVAAEHYVDKCAHLRRVLSPKFMADLDELAHPAKVNELRQSLQAGVVDIAQELNRGAIEYAATHELNTVADVVCVAMHPQMFVKVEGCYLETYFYSLGGPMRAADLTEEKEKDE